MSRYLHVNRHATNSNPYWTIVCGPLQGNYLQPLFIIINVRRQNIIVIRLKIHNMCFEVVIWHRVIFSVQFTNDAPTLSYIKIFNRRVYFQNIVFSAWQSNVWYISSTAFKDQDFMTSVSNNMIAYADVVNRLGFSIIILLLGYRCWLCL